MSSSFSFDQWMSACQFASTAEAGRSLGIPEKVILLYKEGEIVVPLSVRLNCEKVKARRKEQLFGSFGELLPDPIEEPRIKEKYENPPISLDVSSPAE